MSRACHIVRFVVPALVLFGAASTVVGSVYSSLVLTDGPVGYWRLGETSGTTAASEGGSLPGTYICLGPATNLTLGQPGAIAGDSDGAVRFQGTATGAAPNDTGYVRVNDPGTANFPLDVPRLTMEAWVKWDGTGGANMIINKDNSYEMQIFGGNLQAAIAAGSWAWKNGGTVTANQWSHVAVTYDGSLEQHYVNGQLAFSTTLPASTITATNNSFQIGHREWADAPSPFNGAMDEVAIYNRALTPGQLATHYATGVTGVLPAPAELVTYHFDEGAGTATRDATLHAAHGTLTGGPTWTTGKFGSALAFDGSDDRVSIVGFPAGDYAAFSAELWLNIGDKQGKQVLLNDQSGDTLWLTFDENDTEKLDVFLGDTSNRGYHRSNAALTRGQWTHLALTYSDVSDELKLYINGLLDRTITTSGVLKFDSSLLLGAREYSAGQTDFFKGTIDEVALYSRVLSPLEVQARALGGPPVGLVPEPSAVVLAALGLVAVGLGRWAGKA